MTKRYYVQYWNDFGNTYNLFWADDEHPEPEDMDTWEHPAERITRKEAEALARRERRARANDPAFSGYADDHIFPIDFKSDFWPADSRVYEDDCLILYV